MGDVIHIQLQPKVEKLVKDKLDSDESPELRLEIADFMRRLADIGFVHRAEMLGGKLVAQYLREIAIAVEPIEGRLR